MVISKDTIDQINYEYKYKRMDILEILKRGNVSQKTINQVDMECDRIFWQGYDLGYKDGMKDIDEETNEMLTIVGMI